MAGDPAFQFMSSDITFDQRAVFRKIKEEDEEIHFVKLKDFVNMGEIETQSNGYLHFMYVIDMLAL